MERVCCKTIPWPHQPDLLYEAHQRIFVRYRYTLWNKWLSIPVCKNVCYEWFGSSVWESTDYCLSDSWVSQHLRLPNFVTTCLRNGYRQNAVCIPETFSGVQLYTFSHPVKCLRFISYELFSIKSLLIFCLMNWPIFINFGNNFTPNSKSWLPALSNNITAQQTGGVVAKLRTSNKPSSNYAQESVDVRKIRNFVQLTLPQTAEQQHSIWVKF